MGIDEKGSGDVVSAVCYTMYSFFFLWKQTAETTSLEPFLRTPLYYCISFSLYNNFISAYSFFSVITFFVFAVDVTFYLLCFFPPI